MGEKEICEKLESSGYDKVWVYEAEPNEVDEEHKHDYDTKLHILSGNIRLKILDGGVIKDFLLKTGDEKEILRDQIHSARVGSEGCRYVVAEKH